MVAGLAFLSKKSFNPKNLSNQKAVWEAREQNKQEERRIQERQNQLRREQEEEELARVRHGETGGEKVSLSFMYAAPPGLNEKPQASNNQSAKKTVNLFERQPGDDDAAAEFRALLAGVQVPNTDEDDQENEANSSISYGVSLQGSSVERSFATQDGRSALEKAVGRKEGNNSLTLEQQVARFPQLQHAPMVKGMKGTDVQVSFKPLGAQLRNVQCMVCGIWGHSKGDRECSKSGWDPFSLKEPFVRSHDIKKLDRAHESKGNEGDISNEAKKRIRNSDSDSHSEDSYERARRKKKKRRKEKRSRHYRSDKHNEREEKSRIKDDGTKDERRHHRKRDRKRTEKKHRKYSSSGSEESD
jgi:CBF1 interacting corepressor